MSSQDPSIKIEVKKEDDFTDNHGNGDKIENGQEKAKSNGYHFVDTVKIGDETILTVPVENIFYEENKPKRKSRWGDAGDKKPKKPQDLVFNPLQALIGPTILPIAGPSAEPEKQTKSTKWGPEYEKTFNPPMFYQLARGLSIDDIEYLTRLYRLDEIDRNLTIGELEIGDPDVRSLSPDPVYDKSGVRINTREHRAREKLIREKNDLIEECMKMRKTFVPPADYRPPKKSKKIFLPGGDTSDQNYIGMILGPRGTTQKQLENKSGCKISIRGKGSSKQKRMEYDSEEQLHVLIQADTDEALEKGSELIEKLLKGNTEGETDELKKNQLMQLAAIQGTLRDDWCDNCGEKGHRAWACPNKTITWKKIDIKCAICGDRSHPTSDCPQKKIANNTGNMFSEYSRFKESVEGKGIGDTVPGFNFLGATKPILPLAYGANTFAGFNNQIIPTAANPLPFIPTAMPVPQTVDASSFKTTPPTTAPTFQQNNPPPTPTPNPQLLQSMQAYGLPAMTKPGGSGVMAPNPAHLLSAYSNNPYLTSVLPQHLFNPNYQATAITVTNVVSNTPTGFSQQNLTNISNYMQNSTLIQPGMNQMGLNQQNLPPYMVGLPQNLSGTNPTTQPGFKYSSMPPIPK